MTVPDQAVPDGALPMMASLRTFQDYHWLMLKVFYDAVLDAHGTAGLAQLAAGMRQAGVFRGTAMRDQPASFVAGRGPAQLVEHWDTAEWQLGAEDGTLRVTTEGPTLTLTLPEAPGRAYLSVLDA